MLSDKGFTLIEMIVVLAIAAILAMIAVPNYMTYKERSKLRGATSNLVANFELARSRAIKENGNVAVVFNADGRGYMVFEDFNSNWTQDADELLLRSAELPSGVSVNMPTTFASDRMHFNSRGIPDGSFGTATLRNSINEEQSVVINIAGRIRRQ
ncbi:MAG: GspH/FimT family pseudopilin [Desulfosarcina sp.]|nr:GspH/FimT family pseudopilin [Desulfobacterales bacterium]